MHKLIQNMDRNKTNFEKTACKVKFHIFLLETTIYTHTI